MYLCNMEDKKIRNLTKELVELGFSEADADKIIEWTDNLPIRIYGGENIQVEMKKGAVNVNAHIIDPKDLSFNNLPEQTKLSYLWDHGYLYNPFKIKPNTPLYSPFTGIAIDSTTGEIIDLGNEVQIFRNPFHMNITRKIEYKDSVPYKVFDVDENNEWVEGDISELRDKFETEKISYTKRRERIKEAYRKYTQTETVLNDDGTTSQVSPRGHYTGESLKKFTENLMMDSEFYDKWGNKCFDNE